MLYLLLTNNGSICIICIIRVIYLQRLNISNPGTRCLFLLPIPLADNVSDDLENGMNWSNVELAVAILCACLPTYGPLLKQVACLQPSMQNWYGSFRDRVTRGSSAQSTLQKSANDNRSAYNRFEDDGEHQIKLTRLTRGVTT